MTEQNQPSSDVAAPEPTEERPGRRQRALAASLACCGFLLMYCLLSGPMAFLHRAIELAPFRRAIEVLYAPVVAVVENDIEPFATVLKAWIGLFT